jgi:hypothetical protein
MDEICEKREILVVNAKCLRRESADFAPYRSINRTSRKFSAIRLTINLGLFGKFQSPKIINKKENMYDKQFKKMVC